MAASMRVILSMRATWAIANDVDVEENVRTASMMVRKSWVEIEIYCGGGAEVLSPVTSGGAVLRAGGPEETEGNGAGGTRAVVAGARGGDAGTEGAGA